MADDAARVTLAALLDAVDPDPVAVAFRAAVNTAKPGRQRRLLEQAAAGANVSRGLLGGLAGDKNPDVRPGLLAALRAMAAARPADFAVQYAAGNQHLTLPPPGPAEAVGYLRAAVALRPTSPYAYDQLGHALFRVGDHVGAVAAHRRAVELDPVNARFRYNMATQLFATGDVGVAAAALQAAGRLDPLFVGAHVNFASGLAGRGRDADGYLLYRWLMTAGPEAAADPATVIRYNAACFACRYAAGRGKDIPPPGDAPKLRAEALAHLRADLAAWRARPAADRPAAVAQLKHMLADADFFEVRHPMCVAFLPPAERDVWRRLWADVRAAVRELSGSGP